METKIINQLFHLFCSSNWKIKGESKIARTAYVRWKQLIVEKTQFFILKTLRNIYVWTSLYQ